MISKRSEVALGLQLSGALVVSLQNEKGFATKVERLQAPLFYITAIIATVVIAIIQSAQRMIMSDPCDVALRICYVSVTNDDRSSRASHHRTTFPPSQRLQLKQFYETVPPPSQLKNVKNPYKRLFRRSVKGRPVADNTTLCKTRNRFLRKRVVRRKR